MLFDEVGGRRRGRALAAALAIFACALFAAPVAVASEFTVDSTADEIDAAPGDEACLTAGGDCTLRAAIEAADILEESGTIQFALEPFEGTAGATIALGSGLPAVTVPLTINGRTCDTAAGVKGPCVGIEGVSGDPALVFESVEEVGVWGLAITGAQTAIVLEGSPRAKIQTSWFGVKLDGSADGNETGMLVGPGSNRGLIGSEGPEEKDVFAASVGDGLEIHGASNTRVFGNYFGVAPDGVTPRPNGGDDVEVASIEGFEAVGTAIGTRVSATASASPQCDGGCNVISAAGANGIDLQGDGEPEETPAVATAIAGNYIGLDPGGIAAVANAEAGVRVGQAVHTSVGGPSAGEINRINGGSAAILAGPAASDLAVRGNLIGVDATGTSTLAPPNDGIVVDSAELPSPAVEAEIVGNEIRMGGGVAISQQGQGAWISGNQISGATTGIRTFESTAYGNIIEGNLIEEPVASGVLLENDLNEVVGNTILGAGGAGIRIEGAALEFGVSGNRIGGETGKDENLLAGSGGDAIELSSLEKTRNEVARNRGFANGGLFIDLVAVDPNTEDGPNEGIEPPTFSAATETGAAGNAEAEATVRVFRKQGAAAGELESFLGEAVADGDGNWEVAYGSPIPAGTVVAATQTEFGGTSELSTAMVPGGGDAGGGGGASAGGGAGVSEDAGSISGGRRVRPQTRIDKAPEARSPHRAVRFVFRSNERGSVFLCRLDYKPFDLCRSPKRYKHLAPGRHLFQVRAVDRFGHIDPTPAKKKFTVLD